MKKISARELALTALFSVFCKGAYSNIELDKLLSKHRPGDSDGALATRLVYGVIQNYRVIDRYIAAFSKIPIKKMSNKVLIILRLGFYQLLYMDRIPKSAAVNEAVKLARTHENPGAAGFVNAVLRNFIRAQDSFSLPKIEDKTERLCVEYSLPLWMGRHFISAYGEDRGERIIRASNASTAKYIRLNKYRADEKKLKDALMAEGAAISAFPVIDGAYILDGARDITKLTAYREGMFFVEDITSQIAAKSLLTQPGDVIMDVCAAPGSKSFAIAQDMDNRGRIIASDLHSHRLELIKQGQKRLGISIIETKKRDAAVFDASMTETAHRVLVDAPCSGLGTIAKKPDIRFKHEDELKGLTALQLSILETSSRYVKPGGTLIYSTCTLNPRENEGVVAEFLKGNHGFLLTDLPDFGGFSQYGAIEEKGMVTFLPDINLGDGFFIAKLKKVA